jgi:hypothetical protein
MSTCVCIPNSVKSATRVLESTFDLALDVLPKVDFVRAWCALSYLNPGLHPDEFDEPDGGWPANYKRYAVEAWRREEAGELAEEEMFPSDATWAGLYDQMQTHTDQETVRRLELAADYGGV